MQCKKEVSKDKPTEIKEIDFKKSTISDKDLLNQTIKDFNEKFIVEIHNSITEEITFIDHKYKNFQKIVNKDEYEKP